MSNAKYFVNGLEYSSLHNATTVARRKGIVILDESGAVVEGALIQGKPVSAAKMRRYLERKAAYDAQVRMKAAK